MDLELRVLRYFLAAVRNGSITAAANELHITQPTLSKQLMDLESKLGKTLFIRGGRKITLTEEGKFLYDRANEIVSLADSTEAELKSDDDIINGSGASHATFADGRRELEICNAVYDSAMNAKWVTL